MDIVPQEDLLFEAAFLEESASWSSGGALLEESSTASSSIHLLSLGPDPSPSYELTRSFSTGPDTSGLESLEAAGEPDAAWQKLYQRLEQQRGRSGAVGTAQMLKKGNEDLLQVFIGGAPEAGALQQMASQLGQSKQESANSKVRGAAAPSADALTC